MAIADDFEIDLSGNITYVGGGSTYYTVLELHRWLQDLADDEAMSSSSNDLLDITSQSPSTRSTDNIITLNSPYNIDDDAAEQLYDGSITQDDGDTLYAGLEVVGTVESGTELMIIQDNSIITSWWSTGINQGGGAFLMRTLIKIRGGKPGGTEQLGALIDGGRIRVMAREFNDTYAEFQVTLGLGNSTAAIFTGDDIFNDTAQATVAGWDCHNNAEGYQTIDLNNGNGAQPYYSEWDLGTRTDINDLYEFTKNEQRRGETGTMHGIQGQMFRGITHQWDYDGKSGTVSENDVIGWGTWFAFDGGVATENYTEGNYVKIGSSEYMAKIVYYYTGDNGVTGTLCVMMEDTSEVIGDGDEIIELATTYSKDINGTVNDNDHPGGTGVILADDTTDTIWIQMTSGSAPIDDTRVYSQTNDGYHAVNGSTTSRTVIPEFIGVSTGSSIIGAFGLGIDPNDLSSADLLLDLLNVNQQPPNNQTFTVSGLVAGDRVLVCKKGTATEPDLDEYSLQTTLDQSGTTSVVVTGAVSGHTPSTGWLRIQMDTNPTKSGDLGRYRIVAYTSYAVSGNTTFTIGSTDFSSDVATAGNNIFIGLIDKVAASDTETWTGVYSTDVSLLGRVRDGAEPIVPFDTPATFISSGGGFSAIRNADT